MAPSTAFNLDAYETADAVANLAVLEATVLLPTWLLVRLRQMRPRPAPVPGAASSDGAGGRIEGVPDGTRNPMIRASYGVSKRRYGAVMEPMRVFAHHPQVMLGYAAHELAAEHAHRVPHRLKHLAELRAGMLAGCEWCCDFGSAISAARDVAEEDMRALPTYSDSDRFSPSEKLVLDYASGITSTPVEVSDDLFARLRRELDEPQLVELTDIIALENYRARFDWAFGLGSQGFSDGSFCARPSREPTG